jgi:predicted transcriptional regulator with HTH domain
MVNETSFILREIKDTKDLWIAVTGATCHLTNRDDGMTNLTSSDKEICMGNKTKSMATKQGTLTGVALQANDTTSTVTLDEVSVVPELGFSLISITKAMKNGCKLAGDKNGITLSKGDFILTFDRVIESGSGYLLAVKIKRTETEEAAVALSEGATVTYQDFHDMLGHLGVDLVKSTAKAMSIKLIGKVEQCKDCAISKAKQRNVHKENDHQSTTVGERWMIDISSVKARSRGGSKYWLLALDEASDFAKSFFLTKKSETAGILINFFKSMKSKGYPIKFI